MKKLNILAISAVASFLALFLLPSTIVPIKAQNYESEIIIISPHAKGILDAFKNAFEAYAKDVLNVSVTLSYSYYSSEDCYRLAKEWAGQPKADIWWGGGVDLFMRAAQEGLLMAYKAKDWDKVPDDWFGIPAKDPNGYWTGYALSGFGFAYHVEYLQRYKLPEPKNWSDLLNPVYRGHIVMCTPRRSSSTHMMAEIILQGMGAQAGWGYLRRMAVNVGLYTDRSHTVILDVNQGEHGIGLVVDYYGFESAAAGLPVKFVYPKDYSLMNPDSIAILEGAPHPEIAKAFIDYVLSEEGQKLSMGIEQRGFKSPSPRFTIRTDIPIPEYLPDITGLHQISYNATLANQRWNEVNTIYEETIEKQQSVLKSVWMAIENSQSYIAELSNKGYDVSAGIDEINRAKGAFDAGNYTLAESIAKGAGDKVYEAKISSLQDQIKALQNQVKSLEASSTQYLGLAVGLAIVGFIIGFVLGRRR